MLSMTEHLDGKLIAVIVFGYDSDGADAMCSIKETGGIYYRSKARYGRRTGHA
jgi:two-component system, chemotaxis family, protein-glutamate methylesterase/glutaminase